MVLVVAPLLHRFPVVADEVNTTLPPVQNVVGPPAEIVGAGVFEMLTAIVSLSTQPFNDVFVST